MDDLTLRHIQMEMLTIAKEIKTICENNAIQYFLDGGTLLGAVRHHGFIPWDDDLDIGMLRCDFDRFISVAKTQLPGDYFLQTWDTDDEYGQAFAKVRMEGTLLREKNDSRPKKHQGIWVDIFPYDNLPDDHDKWEQHKKNIMDYRYTMLMKKGLTPWKSEKKPKRKIKSYVSCSCYKLKSLMYSNDSLKKKFTEEMIQFNSNATEFVCQESGADAFGSHPMKREYLTEFVSLPFEDTEFPCPKEYDAFLSELFGDYMQPPPVDQRMDYHSIIEVRFRKEQEE